MVIDPPVVHSCDLRDFIMSTYLSKVRINRMNLFSSSIYFLLMAIVLLVDVLCRLTGRDSRCRHSSGWKPERTRMVSQEADRPFRQTL